MDLGLIQDFLIDLQKKKYVRYLMVLIAAATIGTAIYGAYTYFLTKKAQEAQQAFSQALHEFEKNAQAERTEQRWDEIVQAFDTGFQRYAHTAFGPYFLAYKAQALLYSNKFQEALDVMSKLMSSMPQSSPLYALYATKFALMKIDSTDENIHKQGLHELESLSLDINNAQRDWAAYSLGAYMLDHGDREKAIQAWSQLIARAGQSPWGSLAQKKLALLTRSTPGSKK